MPISYLKFWTDALDDPWFINLSMTERGIMATLLLICKRAGDIGEISRKSLRHLAGEIGVDPKTLGKFLEKSQSDRKFCTFSNGEAFVVKIKNYVEWQQVEADGRGKRTSKKREKSQKNLRKISGIRQDKTRLDQTREEIVESWNAFASRFGIPRIISLNKTRLKHLCARLEEAEFDFPAILAKIERSEFLRGGNDRGWKVDFDFVISPRYVKILEGKYDNSGAKTHSVSDEELRKYDAVS